MDPYLQRAHDTLQQSAANLSIDQLTVRPPSKWNIGEILEHLGRAYSGTTAGAKRTVATNTPLAGTAALPHMFRTFVVVGCGYLPSGRAAPKSTVPVGIDPSTALAVALENLREMDAALDEAALHFGAELKLMDHPIIGPLSVRQWRKFHWIHTRHHVRQIAARISRAQGSAGSLTQTHDANR